MKFSSLVLLLLHLCYMCSSEVITNNGIAARFGQRTTLTKSDFDINLQGQNSHCTVRVLANDADLDFAIGRLLPSSFPCNYREGDVYYEHYGLWYNQSVVRLLVMYVTSESEQISISSSIKVNVLPLSTNDSIVSRNTGLSVTTLNGYSQAISSSTLAFTYDRVSQECTVSLLNGAHSWPR